LSAVCWVSGNAACGRSRSGTPWHPDRDPRHPTAPTTCKTCDPTQKAGNPSASVFLATADDIRDPAAQWSPALRRIATIGSKMGADLKRGVDSSRSGPARGRAVSNVPPLDICVCPYAPAKSGAPLYVFLDGSEASAGARMLSTHRFLSAEKDRAERFRPILDGLAELPADAVAAALNARNVPSPRGGRWYAAQVVRMRKRLAEGPRRKTRKRPLEGSGSTRTTGSAEF
jgi:hypothetical protein